MPLRDDVRALADQILNRLNESRDFYLHTRQAWRFVQRSAAAGQAVGIVDPIDGTELLVPTLDRLAQDYLGVHLTEAVFRRLSGLLEDWIMGLARLWLTAYPVQLDAAFNDATGRSRAQRCDEIQVPMSDILAAPDREAILDAVVARVVRELAYRRPAQWFRFLDDRVHLGCPNEAQRLSLDEIKAARDALEHNRGLAGPDYIEKSGPAARFADGAIIEIDEPYLLASFTILGDVVEAMTTAAIRRTAGH